MTLRIRHWLHLPLLTQHEQRMLNGFWWAAVTKDFPNMRKQAVPLGDRFAVVCIIDEFADAIEWLEELKA